MTTVAEIQRAVCDRYRIHSSCMATSCRERRFARPRQVAMYLTRHITGYSLPRIGRCFGGRDHTTVLYGIRKIEELRRSDAQIATDIAEIEESILKTQCPEMTLGGVSDFTS